MERTKMERAEMKRAKTDRAKTMRTLRMKAEFGSWPYPILRIGYPQCQSSRR
jgi:hypothetical protein